MLFLFRILSALLIFLGIFTVCIHKEHVLKNKQKLFNSNFQNCDQVVIKYTDFERYSYA